MTYMNSNRCFFIIKAFDSCLECLSYSYSYSYQITNYISFNHLFYCSFFYSIQFYILFHLVLKQLRRMKSMILNIRPFILISMYGFSGLKNLYITYSDDQHFLNLINNHDKALSHKVAYFMEKLWDLFEQMMHRSKI